MRSNEVGEGIVWMFKPFCYTALILGLVFGLTGSAIGEYTITQITNNTYEDWGPQIDNGIITWYGEEGGSDWEIFIYDIATGVSMQITTNTYLDGDPQIDNGIIAWVEREDGSGLEIFIYDIATGVSMQITNNWYDDYSPQIDNGIITWHGGGARASDEEIFMYDIATGVTTQITTNTCEDDDPQIDNGTITWVRNEIFDEIFMYDIATGVTTQITNNTYDYGPQIDNGMITWYGAGAGYPSGEIFMYDIATGVTTRITNSPYYPDSCPQIDNGIITWHAGYPVYEIFMYDIATGVTTQIPNGPYYVGCPQIDNGTIIWYGDVGYSPEIFMYDIATGVTTQITNNTYGESGPQIDNGIIAWSGGDSGGDAEIFMYYCQAEAENHPPTASIDSITPNPAKQGRDTILFTSHGNDSDGSVVAYNWTSSIDGSLNTSPSFTKPASELSVGTHIIYFTVQDDDGAWSSAATENLTIEAANQPPVASFSYLPVNPAMNAPVTFNASTSYDPDGSIVNYNWSFGDANLAETTEAAITHSYAAVGEYVVNLTITDDEGATNKTSRVIKVFPDILYFDTEPGTYPSIPGTHNGTITMTHTVNVSRIYLYPCAGTGGHIKYARIWNASWDGAEARWNGYIGDWHNLPFDKNFMLVAGETYNYTIQTGSYPQIHHKHELLTAKGWITCEEFVDVNGKRHEGWIPAIRLE
jgi:Tol biopolymer transport system component